ncbi:hypothetical protein SEUCBS139899_007754 [Sporothrix eucalyptigena]
MVTLIWPAVFNAAGYTIYMKSVTASGGFEVFGSTTAIFQGIASVYSGIWTYGIYVGSYNGKYQSDVTWSPCVTPTVCCGYNAAVYSPVAAGGSNGTVYANTTELSPSALPSPSLITPNIDEVHDTPTTSSVAGAQPGPAGETPPRPTG